MRSGHDYRAQRAERQDKRMGRKDRPHGKGKRKTLRDHRTGCGK